MQTLARIFLVLLFCLLLGGCRTVPSATTMDSASRTQSGRTARHAPGSLVSREDVIAIARREAVHGWGFDVDRLDIDVDPCEVGWSVIVWQLPARPGDSFVLLISKTGEVLHNRRG